MDDEDMSSRGTFKRDLPPGCRVLSGNFKILRKFKRDFPPGCGPNAIRNPHSVIPWASNRNSGSSTTATAVKSKVGPAVGEAPREGFNVLNLTSSNARQTGVGPRVDGFCGGLGAQNTFMMMGQKPPKVEVIYPMMSSETKVKGMMPVLGGRTSEGRSKERESVLEMLKVFRNRCGEMLKEGQVRRVDTEAYKELTNSGKIVKLSALNFGDIPGVEVGDKFYYRVELALVGLHRLFQGGIDSIEDGGVRYATCIVSNERHLDKMSGSNILTYIGEGGTLKKRETGIPPDQQLVAGNLALDNSRKKKKPVRVVRGLGYGSGNAKIMYVYDGLYEVVDAPKKRGIQGNMIYEFQLARIPGQPAVPWGEYRRMLH